MSENAAPLKKIEIQIESSDDEIGEGTLPTSKVIINDGDYSDDDIAVIKSKKKIINRPKPIIDIFDSGYFPHYIFASTKHYNFKNWVQCFPNHDVSLRSMLRNSAWNSFFDAIETKPYYNNIEETLSDCLKENKTIIVPYPELVLHTFNLVSPNKISVVFIGQDPYINAQYVDGSKNMVPEAMGFSFSVPIGYPKPPSLNNIYKNLLNFKHVKSIPENGCLSSWVLQGCFMLNASLTTIKGLSNAHKNIWKEFTSDLLAYLNSECHNIIFVVWGKDAHLLCQKIDPKKHKIITSSHPSPYSFDKTFNGYPYGKKQNALGRPNLCYPSFMSVDHFGKINQYLRSANKREIIWDLIDIVFQNSK